MSKKIIGYVIQYFVFVIAFTSLIYTFNCNITFLSAVLQGYILTSLGFILLIAFFLAIDLIEGNI